MGKIDSEVDQAAIHDNVAAEISALSAVVLADADVFIVEDANAATPYSKLKCLASAVFTYIVAKFTAVGLTLGGTLNMVSNDIDNARTVTFIAEVDNGNSSTADTIDWGAGQKQKSTMTGNCTYTFTAPDGACNVILKLIQDGTGTRLATWPGTVWWAGGTAPTLTATAAGVDIIAFYYDGTNYTGSIILDVK